MDDMTSHGKRSCVVLSAAVEDVSSLPKPQYTRQIIFAVLHSTAIHLETNSNKDASWIDQDCFIQSTRRWQISPEEINGKDIVKITWNY